MLPLCYKEELFLMGFKRIGFTGKSGPRSDEDGLGQVDVDRLEDGSTSDRLARIRLRRLLQATLFVPRSQTLKDNKERRETRRAVKGCSNQSPFKSG